MICRSRALEPCATPLAGLAFSLTLILTAAAQIPTQSPVQPQAQPPQPALQQPPPQIEKAGPLDALKSHDRELQAARDAQRKSIEAESALKRDIEQIGVDRRKLNQDLIDTAARLRGVETKIAASQARLKPLDEKERGVQASLDGRRAVIGLSLIHI